MQDLKILNTREKKQIYKQLEEQFGHKKKLDLIFLENTKDKIFLLSNDYAHLKLTSLRINNKALYFAKREKGGLRLSIEGSQMISPTKNIIELNKTESHKWMQGDDIPKSGNSGYVLIKYKEDILGCGFHRDDILRNMVPKERRLHSITE